MEIKSLSPSSRPLKASLQSSRVISVVLLSFSLTSYVVLIMTSLSGATTLWFCRLSPSESVHQNLFSYLLSLPGLVVFVDFCRPPLNHLVPSRLSPLVLSSCPHVFFVTLLTSLLSWDISCPPHLVLILLSRSFSSSRLYCPPSLIVLSSSSLCSRCPLRFCVCVSSRASSTTKHILALESKLTY